MTYRFRFPMLFGSALFAAIFTLVGCSDSGTATTDATPVSAEHADHDHDEHGDHDDAAHQHGEWWCGEHGVPEEECAQCDKSLVAEFKAKGDWCDEHNRPDSQCFIHHPEGTSKSTRHCMKPNLGNALKCPQNSFEQFVVCATPALAA